MCWRTSSPGCCVPESGATTVPIDRAVAALRSRHVPLWIAVAALGALLWALVASWWAPHGFIPAAIAIVALIVVLSRRASSQVWTPPPAPVAPVDTSLTEPRYPMDAPVPPPDAAWLTETRAWAAEDRARRRRSAPVLAVTGVALVLTLTGLGLADLLRGVVLPAYLWSALGIVLAGLLGGLLLRRTPWSLTLLLVPIIAGLVAFGGSRASLHDGVGVRTWAPTTAADLPGEYRLAFGQSVVDLRGLPPLDQPRTLRVTLAAGQVQLKLPAEGNVTVDSHVRYGEIATGDTRNSGNFQQRTLAPPAGARGAPLTVDVTIMEGQVQVLR